MKNQGTILSLLTPIKTFNEICEEKAGNSLEYDEVNSILPYAKEAKEAARDLSQFVLEHVNSSDNDTKRVVTYIRVQLVPLDLFGFVINNFEGSKPGVDILNHSILSIKEYLSNTMRLYFEILHDEEDSSDTKNAEGSKIYEAHIAELEAKNSELKERVAQLQSMDYAKECEALRKENESLEQELADLKAREGIDAPKAALLVRIACTNLGGMPPNRENAWPLLNNLWGVEETNARKRLREGVKDKTVEALAKLFDDVSPKIAGIIREEGKKIIENQKKVK